MAVKETWPFGPVRGLFIFWGTTQASRAKPASFQLVWSLEDEAQAQAHGISCGPACPAPAPAQGSAGFGLGFCDLQDGLGTGS